MTSEESTIEFLQSKIKALELDIQYELHCKNKYLELLSSIKEAIDSGLQKINNELR